MHDAHVK